MREFFQVNSDVIIKTPWPEIKAMSAGVNIRQLLIGLILLVLGTLFYYFFRSAEHTYFLKFLDSNPHLNNLLPSLFVSFGNSIPTFIHVFAFTLMTAGLIAKNKRGYLIVCLIWFTIDVLFEIGQGLDKLLVPIIPNFFSDVFLLENTRNYFVHGRFDYLDLFSIVVGSVAAYFFLIKTRKKRRGQYEKQISRDH
jgi:hypothetical protein